MTNDTKHPTATLVEDIERFTDDIESLHTTLPLIMIINGYLRKDTQRKHHEFLAKHGTVKEKTEDSMTYILDIEHASKEIALNRQYHNFRNAYRLIPRHFVTSLVSQYDSFLGRIIRFMFAVKPEMLNTSDKALSYTQLVSFSDLAAARAFVVEKEIESVIRKSHTEHFSWLKEKLNTSFNKDLPCWPQFVEITERRNLFVHTDGKVSSQYITVCTNNKCDIPADLKVGDQLEVPNDYYESAYRCMYEIGVKLAHVIWRRLCPDYLEESDNGLNEITFELIQKREYEIAIRILDFFTEKQIKHASDSNRRVMLINRAQAYRWNGNAAQCNAIIEAEDWTSCEDRFKLAVATLHDDFDECYTLMRRLRYDSEFHKTVYKDWPLFGDLRKQEKFRSVYQECYGEPLAVEQTTEDAESIEQADSPASSNEIVSPLLEE